MHCPIISTSSKEVLIQGLDREFLLQPFMAWYNPWTDCLKPTDGIAYEFGKSRPEEKVEGMDPTLQRVVAEFLNADRRKSHIRKK